MMVTLSSIWGTSLELLTSLAPITPETQINCTYYVDNKYFSFIICNLKEKEMIKIIIMCIIYKIAIGKSISCTGSQVDKTALSNRRGFESLAVHSTVTVVHNRPERVNSPILI